MTEGTEGTRWGDPETVRILLEDRARALAKPFVQAGEADTMAVLVVLIGGERYGIDAQKIEYVEIVPSVTPLPGAPSPWAGLVNLRGSLCPVLDLRASLGLQDEGPQQDRTLIVVNASGGQAALIGDEVSEIRHVAPESIRPPLAGSDPAGSVVLGVTEDLLTLIDIEGLITPSQPEISSGAGSKE